MADFYNGRVTATGVSWDTDCILAARSAAGKSFQAYINTYDGWALLYASGTVIGSGAFNGSGTQYLDCEDNTIVATGIGTVTNSTVTQNGAWSSNYGFTTTVRLVLSAGIKHLFGAINTLGRRLVR